MITKSPLRRLLGPAAAVMLLAVPLAGCGGSSSGTEPTITFTTPPSSSSSTTTAPPSPTITGQLGPPAPTATGPMSGVVPGASRTAVLTAMRAASHSGFDRVVLQFDGGTEYRVRYVPQLVEDPTGRPVNLAGAANIEVVLNGATLDDSFQGGTRRYTGPRTISPNLPEVQQVAVTGDFEAVLSVGIGVTAQTGMRVFALTAPSRLVIDVAHPG